MAGNRFRKVRKLGAGGQGEVWLVRNSSNEQLVMKHPLASADVSEGSPERARFQREARIQSTLRHPGIMPILGIYRSAAHLFFTMPYASTSLEDRLKSGALSEVESVEIILKIADSIEYAHSEGVLHRDLKPANILLVSDKWVVSDFGLCLDVNSDSITITQSKTVVGSVAYMAPEQFDNAHEVTETADVLSIGKIFYHCLTGKIPFPYFQKELIPAKFRYIVVKCVAEDPLQRYQTVGEFKRELELLATSAPDLTPPMERARVLNAKSLEGKRQATKELAKILIENSDDEIFYKEFVTYLSADTLAAIRSVAGEEFGQIVDAFEQYSEGSHPFSYTDDIANFFANVIRVSSDFEIRRKAFRKMLIVGADHNRFYVGQTFAKVVASLKGSGDVAMISGLLRDHPAESEFMVFYLRQHSLAPAILAALPGTQE